MTTEKPGGPPVWFCPPLLGRNMTTSSPWGKARRLGFPFWTSTSKFKFNFSWELPESGSEIRFRLVEVVRSGPPGSLISGSRFLKRWLMRLAMSMPSLLELLTEMTGTEIEPELDPPPTTETSEIGFKPKPVSTTETEGIGNTEGLAVTLLETRMKQKINRSEKFILVRFVVLQQLKSSIAVIIVLHL